MTLFAEVVGASEQVARTSARSEKIKVLANLLARLEPAEVRVCVGFLSGIPRQGRVGIGYSTIYGIDASAAPDASLTILDVDRAIDGVQTAIGSGSATARKHLLTELLRSATRPEAEF